MLALVFPVASEESAFLATRVGNLVRAAMPPSRIRDVAIEVAGTAAGDEADALAAASHEDVAAVVRG